MNTKKWHCSIYAANWYQKKCEILFLIQYRKKNIKKHCRLGSHAVKRLIFQSHCDVSKKWCNSYATWIDFTCLNCFPPSKKKTVQVNQNKVYSEVINYKQTDQTTIRIQFINSIQCGFSFSLWYIKIYIKID